MVCRLESNILIAEPVDRDLRSVGEAVDDKLAIKLPSVQQLDTDLPRPIGRRHRKSDTGKRTTMIVVLCIPGSCRQIPDRNRRYVYRLIKAYINISALKRNPGIQDDMCNRICKRYPATGRATDRIARNDRRGNCRAKRIRTLVGRAQWSRTERKTIIRWNHRCRQERNQQGDK